MLSTTESRHAVAVGAVRAQPLAWVALAIVNMAQIQTLPMPVGGVEDRLLHTYFAGGLFVACGLISAGLVAAWQRLRIRSPRASYAALFGLACAVGYLVLPPDLANFLARTFESDSGWRVRLTELAIVVAVSTSIPVAAGVAGIAVRLGLRYLVWPIGLLIALGNEWVLDGGYASAHFFVSWAAAVCLARSFSDVTLPGWWSMRRTRIDAAALAACLVFAVPAASIWPPNRIVAQLFRLDASSPAPLVARLRSVLLGKDLTVATARPRPGATLPSPPLLKDAPIVILISVDALRADVVHGEKGSQELVHLRRLREESTVFTRAYSASTWTVPAVAGMLMARYYSQARWRRSGVGQPDLSRDSAPFAPELLREAGITTVQVVVYPPFAARHRVLKGFAEEQLLPQRGKSYAPAGESIDAIIARLRRADAAPLFIFSHLMDPHYPYDGAGDANEPWQGYLQEVAALDPEIGRLRTALNDLGLAHRTILVVTADHGEEFGEHGGKFHNRSLYEEVLRVPLIIRVPGQPARKVDTRVSLVDLAPTLLDLMQVPAPATMMGESLTPLLRGNLGYQFSREVAAERADCRSLPRCAQRALFIDGYKVIVTKTKQLEEIYELKTDAAEKRNLRDSLGPRGDELVSRVTTFFSSLP